MKLSCLDVFCPPAAPCVLPTGFPIICGPCNTGGPGPIGVTLTGVSTEMLKIPGCTDTYVLRRDRSFSDGSLVTDYFNPSGTAYLGPIVGLLSDTAQVDTDTRHHDFVGPTVLNEAALLAISGGTCLVESSFTVRSSTSSALFCTLTEGLATTTLSRIGESRDGIDEDGWSLTIPAGISIVASWEFVP